MSSNNEGCKFCMLINREVECYIVYEDEVSLAFLDHRPLFPGHCLLIPKGHFDTIIDLPSQLLEPFFINVQLLARAMEKGLKAEGSFVAVNNRISQSVPHLHVHIIPRRKGDGLHGFFWPRYSYKNKAEILKIQNTLKSTIDQLRQ